MRREGGRRACGRGGGICLLCVTAGRHAVHASYALDLPLVGTALQRRQNRHPLMRSQGVQLSAPLQKGEHSVQSQ